MLSSPPEIAPAAAPAPRRSWRRLAVIGAAVLVVVLAVTAWLFRENIWLGLIRPTTPYQVYQPPAEPDYTQPEAWAVLPATPPPGAWERPWGVDVFFVGPTTAFEGGHWNAPFDEPRAVARLRDDMLTAHAGPFAEVGAVYAPLYRQAAIFAFATFRDDAKAAIQTAYTDVERAFDVYLRDHHRGRAIVLVGVGQGALHALRLLETRLQAEPYRERLVAAYLIEAAVPQVMVQARLKASPVCTRADQFGCLVSWVSAPEPSEVELTTVLTRSRYWTPEGEIAATAGEQLVCVNPLLWNTTEDYAPERLHLGGAVARQVPFGTATPAVLPRETSAQCMNGVLLTDRPQSRELRPAGLGQGLKTPPFNLFYADLERNVAARAAAAVAWLEANGRRPVAPLPELESLEDAPITLPSLP